MKIFDEIKIQSTIILLLSFLCMNSCQKKETDYSLSLTEYAEMGMPDPDKIWDSDDFLAAYDVLSKLKWENPRGLPKKGSERTGILFDRMISLENLTFLKEDTLKLNEKALLLMNYLPIYENWHYIYTDVRLTVQYHHRELIDIQLFGLSIIELMLDYADQIQKSDDPVDIYLSKDDRSIRNMYVTFILATLKFQKDLSTFLPSDIERLTDIIIESIRLNKTWMDEKTKSSIKSGLMEIVQTFDLTSVKTSYQNLAESL